MERGEQRGQLKKHPAGREKPKCPSANPPLKYQPNQPNPPTEPTSKPERNLAQETLVQSSPISNPAAQADGHKKDVLRNVAKGAQRGGRPGARAMQHAGHAAQQKPWNTSWRATVGPAEQPKTSTKLPTVPSCSTQPRGTVPAAASRHRNPAGNKKPAQSVTIAVPWAGREHPDPRAPCSLDEGLQDRLVCNKENAPVQASTRPGPSRAFQPGRNNPSNKRVLAPKQSSAATSRTITGRTQSRPAKEEPVQDKSRKALPGTQSTAQNFSIKPQPWQPPRPLAASARSQLQKPGANQERTNGIAVSRQPPGKPPGKLLTHRSRPPHVERSPMKPPAHSRPQGTTKPKGSLEAAGSTRWRREAEREDVKVVPPRGAAASRAMAPLNQPCGAHGPKSQAAESDFRSGRQRLKSEVPQARRVPKTPSAADRKKQLEEWLMSKGKIYKRPPMMLLQKQPVKLSWRNVKEQVKQEIPEKAEKPEQLSLEKIDAVLTECLKLAEEGVAAEELSAVLARLPQVEKFAKFWICKAKLLARSRPFDVTGLYTAAVCAGATPIQELQEVVLEILKAANQTLEVEKVAQPVSQELATPGLSERQPVAATSCPAGRSLTILPISVKLQVRSALRGREALEGQELKFLTPVRRSLRIERAGSRYPEMLKDHDPVVSSLREILDADEETQFLFRENKALPEMAELERLSLCPPEHC